MKLAPHVAVPVVAVVAYVVLIWALATHGGPAAAPTPAPSATAPAVAFQYKPFARDPLGKNERGRGRAVDFRRLTQEAERLRSLRFRRRVPAYKQTAEQVRAFLRRELERDAHWKEDQATLEQFGFVPPHFDLHAFMLDFYTEQIAGYYDHRTGAFYMAPQAIEDATSGDPSSLIMRAFGMSGAVEDSLVVHEMDHALQDQYFGIAHLERLAKGYASDDRELAMTALIEGDATVVMTLSMLSSMGVPANMPVSSFMNADDPAAMGGGGRVFSRAPLYIQRLAIFPYLSGALFVDYFRQRGGWNAVNGIYRNPPRCTAQILHPERYGAPTDEPRTLRLPVDPSAPTLAENSMGEERMRILWDRWVPDEADRKSWSDGWSGDTFRVYGGPRGEHYLLWTTSWHDVMSARRFTAGIQRVLEKKDGTRWTAATVRSPLKEAWRAIASDRASGIERRAASVIVIENAPPSRLAALLRLAWKTSGLTSNAPGGI